MAGTGICYAGTFPPKKLRPRYNTLTTLSGTHMYTRMYLKCDFDYIALNISDD